MCIKFGNLHISPCEKAWFFGSVSIPCMLLTNAFEYVIIIQSEAAVVE